MIEKKNIATSKAEFVDRVQNYINMLDVSIEKDKRLILIQELFRYLMLDLQWVEDDLFSLTVRKKLIEFKKQVSRSEGVFFRTVEEKLGFATYCRGRTKKNFLCNRKIKLGKRLCKQHQIMYSKRLSECNEVISVSELSKIIVCYV